MDKQTEIRIHELVFKSVEGVIAEEECRELEAILNSNIDAKNVYLSCIKLNIKMLGLKGHFSESSDLMMILPDSVNSNEKCDSDISCEEALKALCEKEDIAPSVEIVTEIKQPEISVVKKKKSNPYISKKFFSVYNVLVSLAAVFMFLFILYANVFPPQYSVKVAKITDLLEVKWNNESKALKVNDELFTNQHPYILEKGILKIYYNQGVDVIIEGPAEFEIDREGIFLSYGQIYSKVSVTGQGFTIDSPNAKFVDLGTEFGIKVDSTGSSELHVLDGTVQFYAGITGDGRVTKTVREYNAISFDSNNGNIASIPIKEELFVRKFNAKTGIVWRGEKLDLADIIGNGNGFGTGKPDYGIDFSGSIHELNNFAAQRTTKTFLSINDNKFIDCIFMPNGPTRISTSGNIIANFENTNNKYYLGALNGAWHQHNDSAVPKHSLRLDNTVYGTDGNSAIYIHANQGVTFDLDAIRQYSGYEIDSFKACCGISDSYNDYKDQIKQIRNVFFEKPKASFYVLVDGKVKFVKEDTTYEDEAADIDIHINPEDRFLTIATTQGSDGSNDGDWSLFGNPVLEFVK